MVPMVVVTVGRTTRVPAAAARSTKSAVAAEQWLSWPCRPVPLISGKSPSERKHGAHPVKKGGVPNGHLYVRP